ncbi:MAG: hypothetical protein L6V93_00670 [Clostridiales bacterium]|nr:MAG: hypothetical protein L6V93_00670 [Clostridiales bacterium]
MGAEIILRCPIIPTINDREEHLIGIAELADKLKKILLKLTLSRITPSANQKAEKAGQRIFGSRN